MTLVVAEEAHKTDTGRQRQANEDSYFARSPLFAVADGMGGAQAGEVASRIAAGAFERETDSASPPEVRLEGVAKEANREIHELAQRDLLPGGHGHDADGRAGQRRPGLRSATSATAAPTVLRGGELKRLTKDHSRSRSCAARAA